MARNRYGWQKRAKEIARKQKNDDKMKRRQGKVITLEGEEMPESSEEMLTEPVEGDLVESGIQLSPIPQD
ncbi:MAG: hypothetical protein ACYC6G_11525 [Desulfobaccales bacterium]